MKIEAWCVKCKAAREIDDPELVSMKNGRSAAKGKCPQCGAVLYKILSRECADKLGEEKKS